MEPFHIIAALMSLAAVFAYLNYRFLKMPMSIGLMLLSLLFSISFIVLDAFGVPVKGVAIKLVSGIDFSKVLLEGMLGLLLFAGALHVNLNDLVEQKIEITIFATLGVLASTFMVGTAVYYFVDAIGLHLGYVEALLFGALISPTDPIAVLGILKQAGAPKSLETRIAGESLFNDGFGVVVFLVLVEAATGGGNVSPGHIGLLFVEEVVGGAIFGIVAGYIGYRLLKSVDNYQVEVILTMALVLGCYTVAFVMHISGPIAIVIIGLLIGNHGRRFAMSTKTREHLDTFWELVDEILNAVLFVLIGMEVLVLSLKGSYLIAGAIAVPTALCARFISIGVPVTILKKWRSYAPRAITVMTWGGLRGGISVALALSLPESAARELILTMTYVVVVFSILVQGLTIKKLIKN